jgi:hypothetical protein
VEASDWSVDALRWRNGGNRSSTSAGRERQDADELVGGTVCRDAARSYEYADAGKHRSLESGEGSGARCDAKPIGGGERSCSRGANDGIERGGQSANRDWRWKLGYCVRSRGTAICERGKFESGSPRHSGNSRIAGAKPFREHDKSGSGGIGSREWPCGAAGSCSQRAKCAAGEGDGSTSQRAPIGDHGASV